MLLRPLSVLGAEIIGKSKTIPKPTCLNVRPNNIDIRLKAWTQVEIVGANLEPIVRALVDIKTLSDLDCPAVAEAGLPVVKIVVLLNS